MKKRTQYIMMVSLIYLLFTCIFACGNEAKGQEKSGTQDKYLQVRESNSQKAEKMVDVGDGRILNCNICGQGSPTVVLISGFNAPQSYWDIILPFLTDKATVITYDRPGVGKSEKGNLPLDGGQSAKDIHVLLEKFDAPKPYIVVGHSMGVDIARLFASMFPDNVAGLILEDGAHESVLEEQMKILKGKDLELLKKMAEMTSASNRNPQNELEYREITNKQLRESAPLPTIPFVVITSGDRSKALPPDFSDEARKDLIKLGMDMQQRLVDLVPGGKHIIAEGVGHNIHSEKPEVLVEPLVEMISKVKNGKAKESSKNAGIKGAYLGQTPPGTIPEKFAPGIVSSDAHEFSCSFTPDGKEFYFTRMDPSLHRNQIMVTRLDGESWTEPSVVPFTADKMAFEPRVTPDGKKIFFTYEMPVPGQSGPPMNIWYVEREGDKWSDPKDPGAPFNPLKTMYVSMTLDGTVYTTDVSEGPGKESIAIIKSLNGKYQKMERLGSPINVGTQDMYPFIAPDESYLIFASKRSDKKDNSGLFVSFRKKDGTWSDPQMIDLGMVAGLPYVSPDGKFFFFTAGERGKSDIFWVDASVVFKLKPEE
jgi:pimeloyl-ACP methyl ester carboxylesterase